ncbi:TCP-1/cpn60 chaperonin family protein [Xanthocytophaga agilis]|uniref:TCP-1/cpn60 chaperonin family protein n=1 Tax=Xanthocytophaga agilis TaxID=3048010 RepID=A0AAE3UJS3_9BACT|nr:TCP-1/cpn60 chaperonin family protein [Xanthocytophaga agilis]MDJ1506432.1 TCP-1/cpn60 chaperonin family protein [Xanthocytophaga agilis]
MEEGIIPGGVIAYLRCLEELDKLKDLTSEEETGVDIVRKALQEPLNRILINAGLEPGEILQKVKAEKDDYGFNAKTEQYEHLLDSGVIDPVKVARLALEYAASVAGLFITTECVIVKKQKDKEKMLAPAGEMI